MANWGGWISHSPSVGDSNSSKDENFDEDDVWDVDKEKHDDSSSKFWRSNEFSGSASARCNRTDARTNPKVNAATSHEGKLVRGSSPQDIPDWSKIYGLKTAYKSSSSHFQSDGASTDDGADERYCHGNDTDCDNNGDGDDEDDDVVPPHEWIARKLARSQISSFSVCEGVGRTLKGRDLSKVRNAVLTKTGFIE